MISLETISAVPAKAGIRLSGARNAEEWAPACAGAAVVWRSRRDGLPLKRHPGAGRGPLVRLGAGMTKWLELQMTDPIRFTLDGREVEAAAGRDASGRSPSGTASRSRISAGCRSRATAPTATAAPAWSRSRASGCWPPRASAAGARHEGAHRQRARQGVAQDGVRAAGRRPARARRRARPASALLELGRPDRGRRQPLPARAASRRPTVAIRRWRSTSTPASSALAACAPAARSRSTTSSAWPSRGEHAKIVFDLDDPMGDSHLRRLRRMRAGLPDRRADAGDAGRRRTASSQRAGPQGRHRLPVLRRRLPAHLPRQGQHDRRVEGRDGPANHNRLCVKGRFGFDYVAPPAAPDQAADPQAGRAQERDDTIDPANPLDAFPRGELGGGARPSPPTGLTTHPRPRRRQARWPASARPRAPTRRPTCSRSWCAPASAPTTSTTARACATPRSVAALLEGIGSGAVTDPFTDVANAEVIIVIGANPTVNHPVAATWIKNAAKRGAKLIVMDPRGQRARAPRHARCCSSSPTRDVALLNAMMHMIVDGGPLRPAIRPGPHRGLRAAARAHRATTARRRWRRSAASTAETLREVARLFARAEAAMILWGMGISQHVHGTDNARCLIALALMTGQVGRPGTGLHPLRGQNNVQGASDAGLIPMMFPDYQRSTTPQVRASFENALGHRARPRARADRGRDHGRDRTPARSRACTSWARTRRCPTPTSTMRARRWRSSSTWWCRTSS